MQGQGGKLAQLEHTVAKMSNPAQSKSRSTRVVDPEDEVNIMAPEPPKRKVSSLPGFRLP